MNSNTGSRVGPYIEPTLCVCVCVCELSCVPLFATPWTVAHQAPLSMEFSRQEYWIRLPFPTPRGLPSSGIEPTLVGGFFTTWEAHMEPRLIVKPQQIEILKSSLETISREAFGWWQSP